MKEPVPFLPRLRCPKCRNTKPQTLAIATEVYWIYPEWRAKGEEIIVSTASGEVNWSGGPGITYHLMCRRAVCGAITPLPESFRVKLL